MSDDTAWDSQLKSFLKKTGDDFRRFGTDVKTEAEKLMAEVKDPTRQQKLRDGLKDVGVWAKKTAEDVATLVETGVKHAEDALVKASDRVNELVTQPVAPESSAPSAEKAATPPPLVTPIRPGAATAAAPAPEAKPKSKPARTPKTIGRGASAKKRSPARGAAARKTIGRSK